MHGVTKHTCLIIPKIVRFNGQDLLNTKCVSDFYRALKETRLSPMNTRFIPETHTKTHAGLHVKCRIKFVSFNTSYHVYTRTAIAQ